MNARRAAHRSTSLVMPLFLAACTCSRQESSPTEPSATPPKSSSLFENKPPNQPEIPADLRVPSSWPVPSGLRLAVLAGQGVGPIRFGATVATIERLMAAPCEFRTETSCRYVGRAIEFNLKDGAVVEMHLHRKDRPTTPEGSVFGVFNGMTPEGVAFFMLPSAVKEFIGPPKKITPVTEPNPWGMVEIHDYPGMQLEFDRISNGNVVLGGIVLTPEPKKK